MRERVDMQGKPKPVRAHEQEAGKGEKMKSIIQSINPEHVFNMRFGGKGFPLKRIEKPRPMKHRSRHIFTKRSRKKNRL